MVTPKGEGKGAGLRAGEAATGGGAGRGDDGDAAVADGAGNRGGTLPSTALEQRRGQAADGWSDIWALGGAVHELATAQSPFQGQMGSS